ncbi:Ubiquitin carboxyl-terminal hydrolase 10-B [Araneus ventricosus]|uniref:Ubiquitin carboxyl-terminal hydrolase 10-B n=1 Tax=Araneus ventricosus TaxID=182803 RepID=A0A4Y2NB59_ARAVE|nr:Ubiquitin carboxyl-terminal hydrolase 10-B [Araneus ventricosus]
MDEHLGFLNFDGLDDVQVLHLKEMLHPSNFVSEIEFPWDDDSEEKLFSKGSISSLNVHAPAFQSHVPLLNNRASANTELHNAPSVSFTNGSSAPGAVPMLNDAHCHPEPVDEQMRTLQHAPQSFPNGQQTLQQNACDQQVTFSQHPKPFEGDFYPTMHETQQIPSNVSTFKLNPTVSCFIPQNMVIYPTQPQQPVNGLPTQADSAAANANVNCKIHEESELLPEQNAPTNLTEKVTQNGLKQNVEPNELSVDALKVKEEVASAKPTVAKAEEPVAPSRPVGRSWADIVSKGPKPAKVTFAKPTVSNNEAVVRNVKIEQEKEVLLLAEDKMSFALGKHLHEVKLDFHPVLLQPRGLINRRNWCYINACLQALLACSPFYTLLRDLPLGPGVDRGKSSTPVIDSM